MLKQGPDFSLRDKRLFEISEVEITRVDCMFSPHKTVHKKNDTVCRLLFPVQHIIHLDKHARGEGGREGRVT